MRHFKWCFFSVWLLACMSILACSDPTEVGSDLVSGDFSDIRYTDTLSLEMTTVEQERIGTYLPSGTEIGSYLVGAIDDPIFGQSKAVWNLEFLSNSAAVNFTGATFDSLVLSLGYDNSRTYGDTLKPHSLEVHRLTEQFSSTDNSYYSNEQWSFDPTPVGQLAGFMPRPSTSKYLVEYGDTLFTNPSPFIRIQMDAALGEELMSYDSLVYSTADSIQHYFNGLRISSPLTDASLLGFNANSGTTYLRLFYTKDGEQKTFTFVSPVVTSSRKYSEYIHDYTGSLAEPFIGDADMGDSLVFMQGMSGLQVQMGIPHLQHISPAIINRAELQFTLAYLMDDDTASFPLPPRIAIAYKGEDGDFHYVDDLAIVPQIGTFASYGGELKESETDGVMLQTYTASISDYLQDLLECTDVNGQFIPGCISQLSNDSDPVDGALYLQVYLKNRIGFRSVFYGPGHSQYPAKLLLTYTKI